MSVVITPEKPQQSEAPTSPPETKPSYFVELSEPIRAAHKAYEEGMRTTLQKAIELGHLLTEAKAEVKRKRDSWKEFVEECCKFKIRMAQYYMQCYREQDSLDKNAICCVFVQGELVHRHRVVREELEER